LLISPQEAAQELIKRRQARKNLLYFIKYINPDYIVSDFSITVCNELMIFIDDVINGKMPAIVFGAPPQHGKSEIVSRYFPAFLHGINTELAIAGASYNSDIAEDMGRDVQRIINSEEYQRLFPNTKLGVKNKGVTAKQNTTSYEVGKKGSYRGVGVGGGLTGRKVDIGIIDDPIKNSKEALSDTIKNAIWDWYVTTFLTRLSKKSGHIIMATRWALDDLSGKVLEDDNTVKVLKFSAITDGKALIPELHPIEKLEKMQRIMGKYFWSAMYQQNPVALGGNFFNENDLLVDGLPVKSPKFSSNVFAVLDTAVKSGVEHDSTAVLYCAYVEIPEKHLIILDYDALKIDGGVLITWIPSVYKRLEELAVECKPRLGSTVWVEDKSSGSILIQQARLKNHQIMELPSDFVALGKTERAVDVSGNVFSNKVHISEYAYNKTVLLNGKTANHLLTQITSFRLGIDNKKDDLLDTFCYAIKLALL